jgi:hypothetical protein
MKNLEDIISKLKVAFSNIEIKKAVLENEWLLKNQENGINSTGFCYAASEVIYRLTGGKDNWKKVSISKTKWEYGGHCYLINKHTNKILDISSDQYELLNISIPYNLGVAGGFRRVSERANKLSVLAGLGEIKTST